MFEANPKTTNLTGKPKITEVTTPSRDLSADDYKREDFFRDLKKVVRKLPPDHPSRSDSRMH